MLRLNDTAQLRAYRSKLTGTVGLVPTMGALHAGHLSLVSAAQKNNQHVLVSIFVNPTQFDQAADLTKYPNTLEQDLAQLAAVGVNAVFLPNFENMYPDNYTYQVTEHDLSQQYCGAHRPGHFDGVLSVVMKLLNLVRADHAYFGEKDFQQLSLVKGMVAAFFMHTEIVACPIVREADGLAMSSRNLRLTEAQRILAPKLFEVLSDSSNITEKRKQLSALGFKVDYLSVLHDRLLAAASLGDIRLIDNVPINNRQKLTGVSV